MKRSIQLLKASFLLLLLAGVFTSCVKKEFDEPEVNNADPGLTITNTIKSLQDSVLGATPRQITTDVIIAGVVIADDKSGNFYKEMIIQDSTAGLAVELDQSNFNTDFPIGRRVFIKCKGLYLSKDNAGNYTIGTLDGTSIGRIPAGLLSQYLVKGKWGIPVTPTVYALNSTSIPTNTLVKFENVEFEDDDYGQPYANAATLSSANRYIKDCGTGSLPVYSSGYANFASALTPSGNGTLVAVYKKYGTTTPRGELIIRDLNDVVMTAIRCDGTGGTLTQIGIDSLRILFNNGSTSVPIGRKIRGVVISDYVNGNMNTRNMVVQQDSSGIAVRFSAAHNFSVGSIVEVNVSGQSLSEFNGLLQVGGSINTATCQVVGTGSVTPRVATIAEIQANFDAWESTLVKVVNTTITNAGGPNYGSGVSPLQGYCTLNDGSSSTITLYTSQTSTFTALPYPTTPVSVTGILGEYSVSSFNPQITMRSAADVQ